MYLISQNDSLTHGKVYTDVKWLSQHLSYFDFHAVLFWFVQGTSAVRRPTLTLWKGKLLGFRLVETFYVTIKALQSYAQFNMTT